MVLYHCSMIPYGCLSTGSSVGMIEVVYQAETLAKIQKSRGGGTKGAFDKASIWDWLREYHVTEERCVSIKFPSYRGTVVVILYVLGQFCAKFVT